MFSDILWILVVIGAGHVFWYGYRFLKFIFGSDEDERR